MLKRILLLILALLMCSGSLLACSKDAPDGAETELDLVEIETEEDDGIGEYDFQGEKFTILTRESTKYEHIGAMGESFVSEKVYERNKLVSERFHVEIDVVSKNGDWEHQGDFKTIIQAESMAQTGAYDLVSTHSVYLGWMGVEGLSADLSSLPEIDLTKRYWNQNLYNQLNIDGKCYMMIGDIAHTLYEYIAVMFVNTKLIENENIIDGGINAIYDLVDNGKWTWEKLYELSASYGTNTQARKYGLLFNIHAMRASMMAQDAYIYDRETNGRLSMQKEASDRVITAVENLAKFFALPNMYFPESYSSASSELTPMFTNDEALFYAQILGEAAKLQVMEDNYSILPLPKYNEAQQNYYTICNDTVSGVMVMRCAKNLEMSGVITQALCYYGNKVVTPMYYEKILKSRYTNDYRCADMLDDIRDSLTICPVATYYDTQVDSDMFYDIIRTGKPEGIASEFAGWATVGRKELTRLYRIIDRQK